MLSKPGKEDILNIKFCYKINSQNHTFHIEKEHMFWYN